MTNSFYMINVLHLYSETLISFSGNSVWGINSEQLRITKSKIRFYQAENIILGSSSSVFTKPAFWNRLLLLQYPHSTLVYLCVCVQVCLLRTVLMDIFPLMSLLHVCWRDCASSTTGWWWRQKASSSTTSNLTYRSCFRNRCIRFILNTCIHVFNHYSSFPAFFIIYF